MCVFRPARDLAAGLVLAVVLLPAVAVSQETRPQEAIPPPAESRGSVDEGWERLIYLPYKNLKDVLDRHGSTVLLPYLEYLKLWERSLAGERPVPDQPPVSAVITAAHYTATAEKDLARIEARLSVHVLGEPWAELPVRFGEAAVGRVTSTGDRVLLRGTGDGSYSLLLPEKGRHEITLELVSRIHTSPDGRQFTLECPPVGITTFELIVPEADQTVEVRPHLVSLPAEAAAEQTRVKASLGATRTITASWHPRAGLKPEMELLTSVTNLQQILVADGLVHAHAILTYDVLRGALNEVKIALPKDARVLDVVAPEARLEGWQTVAEENRQLLTAKLLSGVEKRLVVEVHAERPLPAEPFAAAGIGADGVVHGIHAVGAVRESGQIVLSQAGDLSLAVVGQSGLTRIAAADVAASLRRNDAVYYRFYNTNFAFTVEARPVEPRLSVHQRSQFVFRDDELRLDARLDYTIERAGVFTLALEVPQGVTLDSVTADGMKEFRFDDGTRTLTVSFIERREGPLAVHVAGHRDLSAADGVFGLLPLLTPLGVERETGMVVVYAPPGIEVLTDEAGVVGAYPLPAAEAPAIAHARLVSAWTYNRRPVAIPVRTVRRPTRLTAAIASAVHLEEQQAEVATTITYSVEHAGIDTFRFAVPEAVKDSVVVAAEGGTVKQSAAVGQAENGWVTWMVVMQQEVVGEQKLRVKYDLTYPPAPDPAAESVSLLAFAPVRVLDSIPPGDPAAGGRPAVSVLSIHGEIAVTKNRALAVTVADRSPDLEEIDVRELELLPPAGHLAFRYYKQPVAVTLSKQKYAIQAVVETVIGRALVEIVLGHDPVASYRCRYALKTSERQRLQVDLPAGAELLGVLVDQTLVTPERNDAATDADWDSFFVNVARTKTSDEPLSLTLQFRLRSAGFDGNGGRMALRLPRIGGAHEHSSLVLQQLRTAVWVPDEIALVGKPPDFRRELPTRMAGLFSAGMLRYTSTAELEQWIDVPIGGMFEFPTEGHVYRYARLGDHSTIEVTWWRTKFLAWLISGAALLIALVLLKTPWHNRITVVLLAVFVGALSAIGDEDWVLHLLSAGRLGLIAGLAVWLIHALSNSRRDNSNSIRGHASGSPLVAAAVIPPPGVFDQTEQGKPKDEST